jgi:hypothetical protein
MQSSVELSRPYERLDSVQHSDDVVRIYPQKWIILGQFGGNTLGALTFSALAAAAWSGGLLGHIAAHVLGLLAIVALLCAVQSVVWAVRRIPTFDFRNDSVIVHLTGWHAIRIPDHEIENVVLTSTAQLPVIVALELASPQQFRGELSVLDRCYFDYSKKFVGCGLSYNLSLSSEEMAQFIEFLQGRFGDRLVHA